MRFEIFLAFQNFVDILLCDMWMQHVVPAAKANAQTNSSSQQQGGEQPPECKQQ
jgi:hypothetical protein